MDKYNYTIQVYPHMLDDELDYMHEHAMHVLGQKCAEILAKDDKYVFELQVDRSEYERVMRSGYWDDNGPFRYPEIRYLLHVKKVQYMDIVEPSFPSVSFDAPLRTETIKLTPAKRMIAELWRRYKPDIEKRHNDDIDRFNAWFS